MNHGRRSHLFVPTTVMFLAATLASSARIDLNEVLGMWLLNEETGVKAADGSGHQHDGHHEGAAKIVDGKFGRAVDLFGAGEGIVIPGLGAVFPPADFTITMWLRMDDWRDQQIYYMPVGAQAFSTSIVANEKLLHFHAGDPVLFCMSRTDEPAWVGKWTHFAFVKHFVEDKAERYYAVYSNGVEWNRCRRVGSLLEQAESDLTFGGQGKTFNGSMDEIAIFTEALSEAQIRAIADVGLQLSVLAVDPVGKLASTWAALRLSR